MTYVRPDLSREKAEASVQGREECGKGRFGLTKLGEAIGGLGCVLPTARRTLTHVAICEGTGKSSRLASAGNRKKEDGSHSEVKGHEKNFSAERMGI